MSSAKWRPFCPGLNVLNMEHLSLVHGGQWELILAPIFSNNSNTLTKHCITVRIIDFVPGNGMRLLYAKPLPQPKPAYCQLDQ